MRVTNVGARLSEEAGGYESCVGRYSSGLADAVVRVARVRPSSHVLDIGCGPGALAERLAALVGPCRVAAVDPSADFVEICRARVPGSTVRRATAEALPFADKCFTAVLSQLALNFMRDPRTAVTEMHRVARPGGVVAAAVWDYASGMTLIRRFWDAAAIVDPQTSSALDPSRTMPLCDASSLATLWREAGLVRVRTTQLSTFAQYVDFEDLWRPFETRARASGGYVARLTRDRRDALREVYWDLLGCPTGAFELAARAHFVVGEAPAYPDASGFRSQQFHAR